MRAALACEFKGEDIMALSITRGRLLAGAALGLGLTTLAPQQAMAACVVSPGGNAGYRHRDVRHDHHP